jgi:hypothetical protein
MIHMQTRATLQYSSCMSVLMHCCTFFHHAVFNPPRPSLSHTFHTFHTFHTLGRPAAETLLLHHEQLKVPENLARFAVRHGMWGFVRSLSDHVPKFVSARRARGVQPSMHDPQVGGI